METMTQVCAVRSPVVASQTDGSSENLTDLYIAQGRIGALDLNSGCFTAIEVFQFAARELVERGLDGEVRALLSVGRQTVRQFLQQAYGCLLGPREYFTPSHLTPAQADAKDFLRILGRYSGAKKTTARPIYITGRLARI